MYERGAILQELQRILASEEFANSERLCRFLTFVVERSLAEESEQLKESVLGIEVFGRGAGYDPKVDPIVRTEARRLRAKLESFYARCGVSLDWEIQVPKGSYVAEFRHAPKAAVTVMPLPAPAAPAPRLEIVPSPGGSALPLPQREVVEEPPSRPVLLQMPARLRVGRGLWAGFAVLAAVVAVGGYWLLSRPVAKNDFFVRPLTTMPGRADFPSLSPDGTQVAFTWDGPDRGVPQIYLMMADGGEPRQLTKGNEPHTIPFWSPDGRWIAYFRRDRELMLVAPLGEERRLGEAMPGPIAWTPDAKHLLVMRQSAEGQSIHRMAVDVVEGEQGNEQVIVPPQRRGRLVSFALSPDGGRLALLFDRGGRSEMVLRDVQRGNEEVFLQDDSALNGFAWTPDGQSLIFSSFRLGRPSLFRKFLGSSAEPVPLAGAGSEASHPSVAKTREGKLRISYFVSRVDTNLWDFELDSKQKPSGEAKRITLSDRRDDSGRFSPDGKRIAFLSTRNARRELFVAQADGSQVRRLAGGDRQNIFELRWSPDGERILYLELDAKGPRLGIVAAGGGVPCHLPVVGEIFDPAWSPSGREVWFLRAKQAAAGADGKTASAPERRRPSFEVASMPADRCGQAAEAVLVPLGDGVGEVQWVPEEQMLYVLRNGDLFRQRWPGGEAELVGGNIVPNWWSSTEAGVFFLRPVPSPFGPPRAGELWLIPKDGSGPRLLETLRGNFEFSYAGLSATRDARHLLIGRMDDMGSHIYLATER
jgi:Tol biopolymer transport system component